MTSRLGRWIEDTFGVEIYKWYRREEWVRTDTVLVHKVVEENGSSVDVKVSYGHEYQHKETGQVKRRVGRKHTNITEFTDREYVENNVRGFSGKKSYPQEKYLEFQTEDDITVVVGEDND